MATLQAQSNGPLYINTVIDTLVVGPAQSPHRCTKCNSPPISGQCTNFILFKWHYKCPWILKG